MQNNIDTYEYVASLGQDLVNDFEKSKGSVHPHECGSRKEKSTINKLKDILPEGLDVGAGFIIDTYGNISHQTDVIIYEKNLALKFSKSMEDYTYYNCESVVAAGEIKSKANSAQVKDAVKKLKAIKLLKRECYEDPDGFIEYRKYLSSQTVFGSRVSANDFLQKNKIYTFILCDDLLVSGSSLISIIKQECGQEINLYPDSCVSAKGKFFTYIDRKTNQLSPVAKTQEGAGLAAISTKYAFNNLINDILYITNYDLTSPLNYLSYLCPEKHRNILVSNIYDL